MSIFSKGLVAAMEEEAQMQATELAIDETGADSAEADMVEATNISADVEQGVNEVEQAVEDANTLERISEVAEKAEEEGGLDPVAAEVMEVAVEAIYARLGIKQTNLPSLESFASRSGRQKATRISVESFKETAKKIWAAVVNAFRNIIEFIKKLWNYFFDINTKLLGRIKKLRSDVARMTAGENADVKASGIVDFFGSKEKPAIMAAMKDIDKSLKTVDDVVGACIADSQKYLSEYKELIKESGDKAGTFLERQVKESELYKEVTGTVLDKSVQGDDFVSNKIKVTLKEKSLKEAGSETWEALKDLVVDVKEAMPFTDVEKIPALNKDEIGKVIDMVETVVKANIGKKAAMAKIEASSKNIINEISKIADSMNDTDTEDVKKGTSVAKNVVTAMFSTVQKLTKAGIDLGLKGAKAGLTYAERSIAAGAKGDEKAKEDKKEEKK